MPHIVADSEAVAGADEREPESAHPGQQQADRGRGGDGRCPTRLVVTAELLVQGQPCDGPGHCRHRQGAGGDDRYVVQPTGAAPR